MTTEIYNKIEQVRDRLFLKFNGLSDHKFQIYCDRRKFWAKLNKDYLLNKNWIKASDIKAIDKALISDYSYPPTYKREWIDNQHNLLG